MFILPAWLIFSILQGFASNGFNFISRYVLRGDDDASKVNAVYQGMMVFSVLAGILFLKERGDKAKN